VWLVLALGVALAVPPGVQAQNEIATDRPDFTETSLSIPRGKLQIETGFSLEREDVDLDAKNGPELLVRFGVLPRTELRIGYNHTWESFDGRGLNSGTFHTGAKFQFAPDDANWGASVIPTVAWSEVETSIEESSADAVFGLIFTWARDVNDRWSMGGVLGPVWDEVDGEGEDSFIATAVASNALDVRLSTFLEWAAEFPSSGNEASHLLHHGYTYQLANYAQIDIHGGLGLTDAASDWFVGLGLAYRAPN
jgi:hypothetical protein